LVSGLFDNVSLVKGAVRSLCLFCRLAKQFAAGSPCRLRVLKRIFGPNGKGQEAAESCVMRSDSYLY
jgi:hypothetical protein